MLKPPSDSQVGGWVAEPKDYMKRLSATNAMAASSGTLCWQGQKRAGTRFAG